MFWNNVMRRIPGIIMLLGAIILPAVLPAQEPVTIARVKYGGGGDWYGNRTTFVNLFNYAGQHTNVRTAEREVTVSPLDNDLFTWQGTEISNSQMRKSPVCTNSSRMVDFSGRMMITA